MTNNGVTLPFAQPSQAFSPAEHREALARAYLMWRRHLASPTRKAERPKMPSAEPNTPQPDKPAKPKRPPGYGTSAWRKAMYKAHAARKRAEARKKAQPLTSRPGSTR